MLMNAEGSPAVYQHYETFVFDDFSVFDISPEKPGSRVMGRVGDAWGALGRFDK